MVKTTAPAAPGTEHAPPGTVMLSATGIEKSFGPVRALQGVQLELRAGEVTALMGENGAGKSTLLKILTGDLQPDAGTLTLAGAEVGKAAINSMVGLLRDGTALPPVSIANTEIVNADNWEEKGVVCT